MSLPASGVQSDPSLAGRDLRRMTITIERSKGWASLGLRDIWEYRELLGYLVWREIQGAYRQTALGMSWLFLRPIVNMLILSLVFGRMIQVPSDNVPYPLFSLAGLLVWGFFANGAMRGARSLVANMNVISKVYFPRLIIPIAGASSGLVDLGAAFCVFFVALVLYRMPLRVEMAWIPLFTLVALGCSLAIGLWLATLSVKYRDVEFAVVFLLQAMMYLSPVIYPVSIVPESIRWLYALNPMTGVIQGYRWALLGIEPAPGPEMILAAVITLVGLIAGAYVFRRTERTVVDLL
jgi:lipopolysaccharide transport system permease protein